MLINFTFSRHVVIALTCSVFMYVCMNVFIYLYVYVCIYMFVRMYVYMFVRMYVYMCVCSYVCIYAPVPQYFHKYAEFFQNYLCNFITELRNVTNWASIVVY